MSLQKKALEGTALMMGGQVLGQVVSFLRNIIVARLISPEDFGIAATFVLVVTMLEMISNLSMDKLLVQAEDGNDTVFQGTAHALQVLRGLAVFLLVIGLAWPFSRFFDIPHALWAFQTIALVPLIRGFVHLDGKRLHRELNYWRDVVSEIVPQLTLIAIAWPLTLWLGDYSAMLWLLIIQVSVMTLLTHAFAVRRYAWSWNNEVLRKMLKFGWPLLLNGSLMFLILQGDRILLGSAYGMANLGVYSVAFLVTSVPTQMVAKVATALLLPLMSKSQQDIQRFTAIYASSVQSLCLIGVSMAAAFLFLGPRVVALTYGSAYSSEGDLIGWLAIMQMIRLLRVGPTIASMAWGDSFSILVGNVGRASLFPGAIAVALLGKPLIWIVVVACAGEVVGLTILLARLRGLYGWNIGLGLKPLLLATLAMGGAFTIHLCNEQGAWMSSVGWVAVVIVMTGCSMLAFFSNFRRMLAATI